MDLVKMAAALGMPQDVGSQALRQAITRGAMGVGRSQPQDKGQAVFDEQFDAFQKDQQLKRMMERLGVPYSQLKSESEPVVLPSAPVVLADDVDARDSEYRRMAQQYAPGSQVFETDAGRRMIESARNNQYEGDAAGLAGFNTNQARVGTGAMPEIIDAMGYTGAMAKWAEANPALALREYNKKFGGPAEYAGTGPTDEAIKAAMAAGQFSAAKGSPNPLGETGVARVVNTAQTAQTQPVDEQKQANLAEIEDYQASAVPGLKGKQMIGEQFKKMLGGGF